MKSNAPICARLVLAALLVATGCALHRSDQPHESRTPRHQTPRPPVG